MTKENVLFSIIGVLLGFIVGFVFANTVNQRGVVTPSTSASGPPATAARNASLPPNHPALPSNAVADQQEMMGSVRAAIDRAKSEPDSFDAQMKAAELQYKVQRYDEAIQYLLRANQLRPESYEAVVNLGNVNYDAGNYEAAERWYTAALVKKPDDVNVRTDLGLTFFLRTPQNIDRAIKEFRRSLDLDPEHELTLQNLTIALAQKGELVEARETFAKLETVNPKNEAIARLRSQLEKVNSSAEIKKSQAGQKAR